MATRCMIRTEQEIFIGRLFVFVLIISFVAVCITSLSLSNELKLCRAATAKLVPVETQPMECETIPDENGKFNCVKKEVEY